MNTQKDDVPFMSPKVTMSDKPMVKPAVAGEPNREQIPNIFINYLAYVAKDGLVHAGQAENTDILGYFDMEGRFNIGDVPLSPHAPVAPATGPDRWDANGRLITHDHFTVTR